MMATDFAGTNTEKIDKLVVAVVDLRASVRLYNAAARVLGPMLIGLLTYLVVQSFSLTSRMDRLSDRLDATNAKVEQVSEKLDAVAVKIEQLSYRLDATSAKLDRLAERVEANVGKLDRIAAQLDRMEKAGKP